MDKQPIKSDVRESMDSKFRYVLVVAERAEQLLRGARAKVDLGGAKPTRVAQVEIDRQLVDWDYGPAPVAEIEEALDVSAEDAPAEASEELEEGEEPAAEGEDEESEVH
ncbi:MAG: DNA-directed RNA polymerase subunit omega [Acidobacteriota bacterium]|jgi:DNA-directed RNA polymerase subunit K/omega